MRSLRSVESSFLVVFAIATQCVWPSTSPSQDSLTFEPYSVFVADEGAHAHCGPAEDYYRTDPLRYGQALEVYAETEDGWLGIRPPEDSFCWVPAETVELARNPDSGTIVEDRTVAWIGTHLGRARQYRWQVQLAEGEPITIIGKSEREGPDGPQLWYRIVPPSGEYRWVHRDDVVMSSEELVEAVRQRVANRDQPIPRKTIADSGSSVNDLARSDSAGQSPESEASTERLPSAERGDQAVASAGQASIATPIATSGGSESEYTNDSGASILSSDRAIGSGLNQDWRSKLANRRDSLTESADVPTPRSAVDAFKQGGLLASLEFLTRPQIQEIGSNPETTPPITQPAADSNWVAGAGRPQQVGQAVAQSSLFGPSDSAVSPASFNPTWERASNQSTRPSQMPEANVSTAGHSFNVVSAERIAQIESEVQQADMDRLNLMLARLMAAQASAAETEPIERAAREFAESSSDAVAAGRARMLAETASRYQRIATRRDGHSVIQTTAAIPTETVSGISNTRASTPIAQQLMVQQVDYEAFQTAAPNSSQPKTATNGIDHGNGVMEQNGYLVQVYSARSNSPPFALTDHAGRTLAYVTPSPGVNLRPHLNSRISVVGYRGYLTGLNTPHIMVTQAVRTPEQ